MKGQSRKLAIAAGFSPAAQDAPCQRPDDASVPADPIAPDVVEDSTDEIARLAAVAKAEYTSRRRRERLFHAHVFAEPAWDMLLDLYIQRHKARPVSIHSLCIAAAVPPTTALRWIGKLDAAGLVGRQRCPHDNRVIHMALSDEGLAIMENYLRGQIG